MTIVDMARELSALVQLDIDVVHAYERAIAQVDANVIRESLTRFRNDHRSHVEHLSAVIRALDAEPPKNARDFDGLLIEGLVALRSLTGTEGALIAMKTNEEFTNKRYMEAYARAFTPNIKELVGHNCQNEQVHLKYIEEALETRSWEK
jgi:rubrerythrin